MTVLWLLSLPTITGPQPFAMLWSAESCDVALRAIAAAVGVAGTCLAFIPGVSS